MVKIIRYRSALSGLAEQLSIKAEKKFNTAEERAQKNSEKTYIYRGHLALFILVFIGLFLAQFHENFFGKIWNPKFNKKYEIITNLHYYCQITGSYNVDQCEKWKNEYKKYRQYE
jgi:hypothetical protein